MSTFEDPVFLEPARFAKVADRIFIGNYKCAEDLQFLAKNDITAIINLSGKKPPLVEDIDYFDYIIPSSELMNAEIQKTTTKLNTIAQNIYELQMAHRNLLICCSDGRNKSMLAAGYYLIANQNRKYDAVITQLETSYFNDRQRSDELEYIQNAIVDPDAAALAEESLPEEEKLRLATLRGVMEGKRAERSGVRGLTMMSFRKLLRIRGGSRK